MLYDRHLMQPVPIGNRPAGHSFAVEIARTIGLPREVIDKAEIVAQTISTWTNTCRI